MPTFDYRNVNDAFVHQIQVFNDFADSGVSPKLTPVYGDLAGTIVGNLLSRRESRDGDVIRYNEPVTMVYHRPLERVLLSPSRDANPFFHLYEAVWMLAGRNDLESLTPFVKQFARFSDDGETLHGAYGYRWREWFGYDQLPIIINELRDNPDSRRCVLQMWEASANAEAANLPNQRLENGLVTGRHDLYTATNGGRDVPCLDAETRFLSPEGELNIRQLSNRFSRVPGFRYPIYTVDPISGEQKLTWMTRAWKSGTKQVYRITFDDGTFVECTANHRFFLKEGFKSGNNQYVINPDRKQITEKRVDELSVGDRLLATKIPTPDTKGYVVFKGNVFKNTNFKNMKKEHRKYMELVLGYDLDRDSNVHHMDECKTNNRLTNLEVVSHAEHSSRHKIKDNPMVTVGKSKRVKKGKRHSTTMQERFAAMDVETRAAYTSKKAFRTERQQRLIDEFKSSYSNHKIVSIEEVGVRDVYDFTVPDGHNAVLSNGVVTHNCNLSVLFEVQPLTRNPGTMHSQTVNQLHMTVINRSNDLVMGALGANFVHFSYLLEYVAAFAGYEVGTYRQVANNLHVYTGEGRADLRKLSQPFDRSYNDRTTIPFVTTGTAMEDWDRECEHAAAHNYDALKTDWFVNVFNPAMIAHFHHKNRNPSAALRVVKQIQDGAWRRACSEWLERRYADKDGR